MAAVLVRWFSLEKCFHLNFTEDVQRNMKPNADTQMLQPLFATSSPLKNPEDDFWSWNPKHKSCDAHIIDDLDRQVIFHPSWSFGTSAIRGIKILNNTRSFWEIEVTGGLGGTSLMFGIGTEESCLGAHTFCDLIGSDEHSWGLSHRGLLWHGGSSEKYCRPFKENTTSVVGLLFDGIQGTLTYYKDGQNLGIAFRNLDRVNKQLYPIISSTAMRSLMCLQSTQKEFVNLQDRCRAVLLKTCTIEGIQNLPLPRTIRNYLHDVDETRNQKREWYVPRF